MLGMWILSRNDTSLSVDGKTITAGKSLHAYIADTDGWSQTGNQSVVLSPYDLALEQGLASVPKRIGDWQGEDVPSQDTDLLGFRGQQHVFRSYTTSQGKFLWLRLLTSTDWKLFYHSPPICYKGNSWDIEPERSYSVLDGDTPLRMQGFIGRLGSTSHLVLYTFLWPNKYRDMHEGATMVEVVAPLREDGDAVMEYMKEFIGLIFSDNSGLTQASPSPMQYQLDANLDDRVALVGYDLDSISVRPGGKLRLTLYWQARAAMHEDYTVFIHLLKDGWEGEKDPILVQEDRQPFGEMFPTSKWSPGHVVKEVYELEIPANAGFGKRDLEVGMYLLSTGQRLGRMDSDGRKIGDSIFLQPIQLDDQGP